MPNILTPRAPLTERPRFDLEAIKTRLVNHVSLWQDVTNLVDEVEKLRSILKEILACDSLAGSIHWKGCPAGTSRRRSKAVKKARELCRA